MVTQSLPPSQQAENAVTELLAESSEVGAGTVGVAEASTLTVAVAIVGAVQAMDEQSQVMGLIVTTIVAVDPELEVQSSRVVVIVSVSVTVEEIWLPY